MCDDQDLAREDIAILEIDRTKLAKAIAAALSLSDRPLAVRREAVIEIGRHDVYAGRGFPVFLVFPGPWFGEAIEPFAGLAAISAPKVLLTPTRRSLGSSVTRYLDAAGVTRFALSDILVADGRHRLVAAQPVDVLFAELREAVTSTSASADAGPVWALPPDARWEEITMRFTAREVISLSFRGAPRRIDPETLGMRSRKDGKPTRQWRLLRLLAVLGGRLPKALPPKALQQVPEFAKGYRRQKELLGQSLVERFGIRDNPLPPDGDGFRARFVISAGDLMQGKPDQRERNFADAD